MGNNRILICDLEGREIEPKAVFGNKANQMGRHMERIRKSGMGDEIRYEGCYQIPEKRRSEYEESCTTLSFEQWMEKYHPQEIELERVSCFTQDQKVKKSFKFLCSTARKNGYFLEWKGRADGKGGNPDCWLVKQGKRVVGYIQLISS